MIMQMARKAMDRRLQPVALGMTLTMLIIAQANIRGIDRGTQPPLSYVVACIAVAAVVLLIVGWVGKMQRLVEWGLLAVVFAYTARAAFIMLSNPYDQAIFFSLATIVLAGGSYYLEAAERHTRERRG